MGAAAPTAPLWLCHWIFPMTLTDPELGFQGNGVFEVNYLKNGAS